jgi:hypothetical protein
MRPGVRRVAMTAVVTRACMQGHQLTLQRGRRQERGHGALESTQRFSVQPRPATALEHSQWLWSALAADVHLPGCLPPQKCLVYYDVERLKQMLVRDKLLMRVTAPQQVSGARAAAQPGAALKTQAREPLY